MNLANPPARSKDGHVHVLVEIPKGSRNKYEYNKEWGVIVLDRVLYAAVHYPTDYGFVPQTRSEDGELLDALVLVEEPTFPGCLVATRLIGVLTIAHSSGLPEHKLLAVSVREPRFAEYTDLSDVPHGCGRGVRCLLLSTALSPRLRRWRPTRPVRSRAQAGPRSPREA